MKRLIMTFAALVALMNAAHAQSYADVVRTCGLEWKEAKAKDASLKGSEAWHEFRRECQTRKGYKTKAEKNAEFTRVPDKH
jgi:hypothetical protein